MESGNKNIVGSARRSAFDKIEKIHPVKMLLYLCLIGVAVIFLILVLAFVRTELSVVQQSLLKFPRFFSVGVIFLLLSSFTLSRTMRFYRKDSLKKLRRYLGFTLLAGFAFIGAQAAGWYELQLNGVYLQQTVTGSYLYLISALHAVHVLGGILFLLYFYFKTSRSATDAVQMLVFIRNPYRQLQLSMLQVYWHFMDALWVVLFVFLLFSF